MITILRLSLFLIRCFAGWAGVGVVVDGQTEAVLVEEVMTSSEMTKTSQNHSDIGTACTFYNHSILWLV